MDPLNDTQVNELEKKGFREGDMVPGRGVLLPDGTFKQASTNPTANVTNNQFDPTAIQEGLNNAKALADRIQAGIDSLKAQEQTDTETNAVVSSESVVQQERETQNTLNQLQAPSPDMEALRATRDASISLIEQQATEIERQRQEEIESINAEFDALVQGTEEKQGREAASFRATLTRIGGYLGGTASGVGALNTLASEHRAEIASIESKRAAAIQAANSAAREQDFALAREKIQQVQDFEKLINDRQQQFFDNSLDALKEIRQEKERRSAAVNRLRDDARTTINTIISNFGSIDIAGLDEQTRAEFGELAATAGFPITLFGSETLKEKAQRSTEEQRAISNAISMANLQIRQQSLNITAARFEESQKLTTLDAQRLGLPRELVGRNEDAVLQDFQSDTQPDWFSPEKMGTTWNEFRTEVLTTSPVNFFAAGPGLPAPVE